MSAQQSIPWEQQALHIAIDTLQEALPGKPKDQQQALHMSLMTLRGYLAMQNSVDEDLPLPPLPSPSDSSRTSKFKQLLSERRTMAGLSQVRLAELAGLPESAIANIESGRALPTQLALLHLLSVPELKLEVSDLPWEVAEADTNFALNC